ncbi:hypothetical protein IEQ34_007857 [Dendrobium chrysotoxum]|uniref:Uncharacterized protein n=1 Tax=Dendrobium chrysotoxum TaxID=161865 RepID=A0AAV7GN57_DENCH|nr:hypothetical protein IEQ34_007857 [Dendrobium chrysotoxum]
MFVAPIMEKLINTGFQYLGDQVRWQTGMKEELAGKAAREPSQDPSCRGLCFQPRADQIPKSGSQRMAMAAMRCYR